MQGNTLTGKLYLRPTRLSGKSWLGAAVLGLLNAAAPRVADAEEQAGLTIETGSPDALCPELESTRAAVRRRLGAIEPGGSAGFRARYTIGHAPVGALHDFVRLELFGPDGQLQLSRDLPLENDSCSTMAEVIALVLDRYFRGLLAREAAPDVVAAGGAPSPDASSAGSPALAPTPTEPPGAPSVPDPTAAAPGADAPGSPPKNTAGESSGLVGLDLAFRSPSRPSLGVRASFEPWSHVYAGAALHVGLVSDTEELADGAEVTARGASLRAYLGWKLELDRVRAYVGPGLRFGVDRGRSEGLESTDVRYRATWGAGIDAGAFWLSPGGWCAGLSAALDVTPSSLGGEFYVAGREVLEPDTVSGWLGVLVGHVF